MSWAGASRSVLVVGSDAIDRANTVSTLREGGYAVVEANAFDRARSLLSSLRPHLLITDIRLGAFNGLHLVWVLTLEQPAIPAIVTNDYPDAVLESEARTLGCPFLIKPLTAQRLLRVAGSLLGTDRPVPVDQRRSPRTRMLGALELTVGREHATVVDISYGGCRLQVERGTGWPLAHPLGVRIPPSDVTFPVVPVWTASSAAGEVYGLAVRGSADEAQVWRDYVDHVRRG